MKKLYAAFLCLFLLSANSLKAQYVTIPDANFVTYLNNNYPQCMVGNQMDTTCGAIVNEWSVDVSNKSISSLEGIQYFDILSDLRFKQNSISVFPVLPKKLTYLDCRWNSLKIISGLPSQLETLECSGNEIDYIDSFPQAIRQLLCESNLLTSLPTLPSSLQALYCGSNDLSNYLPFITFPQTLERLNVVNCQLSQLPALPFSVNDFSCGSNQLGNFLPTFLLPASLKSFDCSSNGLTQLPLLPSGLSSLSCYSNPLGTALSGATLPMDLIQLYCDSTGLTSLPVLPQGLEFLGCGRNPINTIQDLPKSLKMLSCPDNDSLSCLPFFSQILDHLDFTNTNIKCVPPISAVYSNPDLATIPVCNASFNPSGCSFTSISGTSILDNNANCTNDGGDTVNPYIKVVLDSAGIETAQHYTTATGDFGFMASIAGTYNLRIDTANTPFTFSCPDTTVVAPSYGNSLFYNCKPGFDLSAQNVSRTSGQLFPGQLADFSIHTGDAGFTAFNNKFSNPCPSNLSATVTVILNGPADFSNKIIPTPTRINADTIEWQMANISTSPMPEFNVITDTSANIGQTVCFDVYIITTIPGDRDTTNNHYSTCYPIVNSYDPNMKEVTPIHGIEAGDWLYYTIHFQNMGNAAAINIKVLDTLDANVDVSTFQLLESSHYNVTEVNGNIVKFSFPNIQLIDSATDSEASKGFVQYRIKIKQNAPLGFAIPNTASIYFDYNPAVVTNTVISKHNLSSSIKTITASKEVAFTLLPNPAQGQVTISTDIRDFPAGLKVYNTLGALVHSSQLQSAKAIIDIAALQAGIYYFNLQTPQGVGVKRLVVE